MVIEIGFERLFSDLFLKGYYNHCEYCNTVSSFGEACKGRNASVVALSKIALNSNKNVIFLAEIINTSILLHM